MDDAIEDLNERDDVEKTEYTYRDEEDGRVKVEMWHNSEALQRIFQRSIDGLVSPHGLREFAEEQAIIVRETRIVNPPVNPARPDIVERLKEESEHNEDYEYRRKD